jgi:outer membrane lipoprotein SlyB
MLRVGAIMVKGARSAALVGSGNAMAIAGGAIIGPIAWTFVGVVFIAEAGINYRRMKKGFITRQEFKTRMKQNAVGTVGGLASASAGGALGFLIGSAIVPGVGSAIGCFVGCIAGGITGKRLSEKILHRIEHKIEQIKVLQK